MRGSIVWLSTHDSPEAFPPVDRALVEPDGLRCGYHGWKFGADGSCLDQPAETAGNQWDTIFDVALAKGLSARYYNSDLPFSATFGARGATWTRRHLEAEVLQHREHGFDVPDARDVVELHRAVREDGGRD